MSIDPLQYVAPRLPYDPDVPHQKMLGTLVRELIRTAQIQRPGLDYYERDLGTPVDPADLRQLHEFASVRTRAWDGPVLVFALASVTRTLAALRDLQSARDVSFLMAAKSAPPGPVAALAAEHLSGFDVSNLSEYQALPVNLEGLTVFVTSPRLPDDLGPFLARGNKLVVTVSTPGQHRQLAGMRPAVDFCVRLNPSHLLGHESHFGATEDLVSALSRNAPHRFVGFHLHSGFSTDNVPESYVAMARWAADVARAHDLPLDRLNLGGGICFLSDRELADTVVEIRAALPNHTALTFEPGRPLTENAGYALARVLDTTGDDLTVDLSAECHLRWSLVSIVVPRSEGPTRQIRIFGPTCSEGDVLGTFEVPVGFEIRIGDVLLFGDVVGYSACWNLGFNGVPAAAVDYIPLPERP